MARKPIDRHRNKSKRELPTGRGRLNLTFRQGANGQFRCQWSDWAAASWPGGISIQTRKLNLAPSPLAATFVGL